MRNLNLKNKIDTSHHLDCILIISDGNFLFRSISFSLNGHQDILQELRNLAVETSRGNVYVFQNYNLDEDDAGKQITEIYIILK